MHHQNVDTYMVSDYAYLTRYYKQKRNIRVVSQEKQAKTVEREIEFKNNRYQNMEVLDILKNTSCSMRDITEKYLNGGI